ncbi:MAG: hypothetical protein IT376_23290 [Polyangiaceae bacterium]|nr:hypothetical protein [Polyangiaceae bacterium]
MASKPRSRTRSVVAGGSWLALVASTTMGIAAAARVRAEVQARIAAGDDAPLRLVVQSFAQDLRGAAGRPVASVQREVTREELARGVAVDLLQLGAEEAAGTVVAWVEPGRADLTLDGLSAVPGDGAWVGRSAARAGGAQIVLRRA